MQPLPRYTVASMKYIWGMVGNMVHMLSLANDYVQGWDTMLILGISHTDRILDVMSNGTSIFITATNKLVCLRTCSRSNVYSQ